ncbi:MAG: TRAP transporter large permease, partial [Pseudodonghicola sp.]
MDTLITAAFVLVLLLACLGAGIWVFASLLLVSAASLHVLGGMEFGRIGSITANIVYRYSASWELSAIPLFIWMGEIIFRTDISARLFRGLVPFVDHIPGRLLHSNVFGCTLFAAVSGSSPATTATVGRITTGELLGRGYDSRLTLGSLAGAGSLGLLIPPSLAMIVYGILAEQSITRLFAAGVLPGLMIAGLYSAYIMLRCTLDPALVPDKRRRFRAADYLRAAVDLSPLTFLMVVVLGSIYSGLATPSEAAAVGVLAAMAIALALGQFSLALMRDTLMGALRTSAMVCSILIAAAVMSTAMGYLHIPNEIARAIGALELSPWALLLVLSVFYLGLGFFLDGNSIVVMSLPIALPLVLQAGFDPIWFGIYLVLMVEMAQVTPPVGFNLFVLQKISGHP